MAIDETRSTTNAFAAVAIVALVVIALAAGWVLFVNEGRLGGGREIEIEMPGRR